MLDYIITNFNNSFTAAAGESVMSVRKQMISIERCDGVILARCHRGKRAQRIDGNDYKITISDHHYHCTCMSHTTSARDPFGHKKACKHIIFVACAAAIHFAQEGEL